MGGDSAPASLIEGAKIAQQENPDLFTVLVGNESIVESEMKRLNFPLDRAEIVHASQVVTMNDPPTAAVREKKDSSITVALTLHRMGKVKAVVGAGNTGGQLAASMVKLGRIEGVLRPVIGTMFPTLGERCLLLDIGANTDCRAIHLLQFAIMGAIFMKTVMGIENPKVGLLSIGSEKSKGNEVSLFAHYLLRESHLNFIGNIEGSDLLSGKAHVAVCDGFVGNIVLKFAESFPRFLLDQVDEEKCSNLCGLKDFLTGKLNPEYYGGVPILGVDGVSIVCHGASSPRAIANGIKEAVFMAERNINASIAEQMQEIHSFYTMNKYFTSLRDRWENKRENLFLGTKRFFNWMSDKDTKDDEE